MIFKCSEKCDPQKTAKKIHKFVSSTITFSNLKMIIEVPLENFLRIFQIDADYLLKDCGHHPIIEVSKFPGPINFQEPTLTNVCKCPLKVMLNLDHSKTEILISQNIFKLLNFSYEIVYTRNGRSRDTGLPILADKTADIFVGYCTAGRSDLQVGKPFLMSKLFAVFKPRKPVSLFDVVLRSATSMDFSLLTMLISALSITRIETMITKMKWYPFDIFLQMFGGIYGFAVIYKETTFSTRIFMFINMFVGMQVRAYLQGTMFNVFTLNWLHSYPSKLSELRNPDVRILGSFYSKYEFNSHDIKTRDLFNIVPTNLTENELFENFTKLPHFTGIFADYMSIIHNILSRSIEDHVHVLKEPIVTIQKCMYFQKNSPLKFLFDKELDRLTETGWIDKFTRLYKVKQGFRVEISKTPQPISMTDLSHSFSVYLISILVCLTGFAIEIFWHRIFLYRVLKAGKLRNNKKIQRRQKGI